MGSDLSDVVIDSIYADLTFNRRYFVVHSLLMGGGISRGLNGQLVQSPDPEDNAMSVVFKHVDSNAQEELVTESTPLNIVFSSGKKNDTMWMVEDFPRTIDGPYYLSSNGVEGNPSTRFQIKKVSYFSYKLVYCPDENTCTEVGYVDVYGQRRLALATGSTKYFPIVFAQDSGRGLPVVLDGFFNHVRRDNMYFVLNVLSIDGGGVTRGPKNEILQSAEVKDFGMSVVFKPKDPMLVEITESTPLNVVFCSSNKNGTVWKVEENYLSSNGVEGDRFSWFQIKRVNYCSYKLVFYQSEDSNSCRDVGFVEVDGRRRLALITTGTTTNLPVLFLKPDESPIPVAIDSYLNDLRFDCRYFVVNSLSIAGGGVVKGPNNELVQTADAAEYGMSVVFKPMDPNSRETLIRESTPLNILFYTSSSNGSSKTVWKVEGFPGTSGPYFLSSNGVEGNPSDVSSWFQIKKSSYFSFKLVFCPSGNVNACSEVGLQDIGGRLVLTTGKTNFPLVFVPDKSSI